MIIKEKKITIMDDKYGLIMNNNRIIVNDGYKGLAVYDLDLNLIKTIFVMNDMLIYDIINISENELLLYCVDNNLLILVNIDTDQVIKIKITPELDSDMIKCLCGNDGKRIILETYNRHYYELIPNLKNVKRISEDEELELINEKRPDCEVSFEGIYESRELRSDDDPEYDERIKEIYVNGTAFYVFEEFIFIKDSCAEEKIIPDDKYMFIGIAIIPDGRDYVAIVLSCCKSDIIADLIKYRITRD